MTIRTIPVGADINRTKKEGISKRIFVHFSFNVNLTELWIPAPSLSKANVYRSSAGFMAKL